MDKLRENDFINKLKQRKIIIMAVIVIFLLIVIISLMLGSKAPPSQIDDIATPTSIIKQISGDPSMPQPSVVQDSSVPKWNTYTGSGYSLEYPPDWSMQKSEMERGVEGLIIRPAMLPKGIYYPEFILEKEPFREGRMEQRISIKKALGLVESKVTILNKPAKKLSGTIPLKKVGDTFVDEPVMQTVIFLTYGGNNYVFEYNYEGRQINKDLEGYFNDFILTVKFQ